ncbi:MAG: hypothetical protein MI924_21515 [Chloroflexales bacterium]|nr:hypothetical protein [Chloroflexales bacterium]
MLNNPLKYTDPSGHYYPGDRNFIGNLKGYEQVCVDASGGHTGCYTPEAVEPAYDTEGNLMYYLYNNGDRELVSTKNPHFGLFKGAVDRMWNDIWAIAATGLSTVALFIAAFSACTATPFIGITVAACVAGGVAALGASAATGAVIADFASNSAVADANFTEARKWNKRFMREER